MKGSYELICYFPCEKYEEIDELNSFITHRNQMKDFKKAEEIGMEAYRAEQEEKVEILNFLLKDYIEAGKKIGKESAL